MGIFETYFQEFDSMIVRVNKFCIYFMLALNLISLKAHFCQHTCVLLTWPSFGCLRLRASYVRVNKRRPGLFGSLAFGKFGEGRAKASTACCHSWPPEYRKRKMANRKAAHHVPIPSASFSERWTPIQAGILANIVASVEDRSVGYRE